MSQLEEAFDHELRRTYDESARALSYRPTYLLNMLNEVGGVEAARRLLAKESVSDGFTTLWERRRLDLAVESIVLKPEFAPLFSAQELDRARQRLAGVGYTPPWLGGDDRADDPGGATGTTQRSSAVERITRAEILDAIDRFDRDLRSGDWKDWEQREKFSYGLEHEGRLYPVKQLIRMAGYNDPHTTQANRIVENLGFTIVDLTPARRTSSSSLVERLSRAVQNTDSGAADQSAGVTGVDAGLRGEDQIRIALQTMVTRGGEATIQQIYDAVEARMRGQRLSEQGKASLRTFINRNAVEQGYVYPAAPGQQSWRITPEGRAAVGQRAASWIFQSNPDYFDLPGALGALTEMAWEVRQYAGEIHTSDTVYLWESGDHSGILAVARVLTEPAPIEEDEAERRFDRDSERFAGIRRRVRLKIEYVLPERIRRDDLPAHPVLKDLAIVRAPQGTNFPLTNQQAAALAQIVDDMRDDEVAEPVLTADSAGASRSLAEWQSKVETTHPLVRRLVTELPAWLQQTFGNRIELRISNKPELGVFVRDYWRIYFAFNRRRSLYVLFANPDEMIVDRLRAELANPTSLKPRSHGASSGYRFFVNTDADYALLKELTLRLLADVVPPPPRSAAWPDPNSARQPFVLFFGAEHEHQRYGQSYSFSNYASGDARKLADALYAWQQGGPPVEAIIYRPGPHYAFTAWARVSGARPEPGARPDETVWMLNLDQRELPAPLYLKGNAAHLGAEIAWLAKGLASAFGWRSIRKIDATDFNRIIDAARAAAGDTSTMSVADAAFTVLARAGGGPLSLASILDQGRQQGMIQDGVSHMELSSALLGDPRFANLGGDMWLLAEPIDDGDSSGDDDGFVPQIYAAPDAQFWRIHFPRELWDEAWRSNMVGIEWPLDVTTNQSVQRLKRINVGDRIVAYVQGGTFGGIGVVTRRYTDIRVTSDPAFPSGVFGGKYPQRIGVAWSDAPAAPVDVLAQLREPANTELYQRVRNPHAVIPLSRDSYIQILTLLQVHDAGTPIVEDESRLPSAWESLDQFRDFMQALYDRPYTATKLHAAAQEWDDAFVASIDPETFADELRQLRVLRIDDDGSYRVQPYVAGDPLALLRLMALALLLPIEGTEAAYQLPARAIVPRLRAGDGPQPAQSFAPELGDDALQLLAWYAEAGYVTRDGDTWQTAADALAPLPGDDPASKMHNDYLATLTAEQDGTLAEGLPPIDGRPLEPVPDLPRRLSELAEDLL
ncbi:MAG TPA: EVE domain-containing protein, partial [Herpetosiphonaceae bacterium]